MDSRGKHKPPKGFHEELATLLEDFHEELEKHSSQPCTLRTIARRYRDRILDRQDSTAIFAYAIKTILESRGIKLDGAGWEGFGELVKQAEKPLRHHKQEEERRRMRALAVLWGQWSLESIAHYKWELHSPKLLVDLGKVAKHFPYWPNFVQNLNCVMFSRHEQALCEGRVQRIGCHNSSSRVQDECSPLEACDVERLLKHPPSDKELQNFSARLKHWISGTYSRLELHGKCLSHYPNIDHFGLQVDQYGMLIRNPKIVTRRAACATGSNLSNEGRIASTEDEIAYSAPTTSDAFKKRAREENTEVEGEATEEICQGRTPAQKRRILSALDYPSPPTSSPLSSSLSPPSCSTDGEEDIELDFETDDESSNADSTIRLDGNETSRAAKDNSCNEDEMRVAFMPCDEDHSTPPPEMPIPNHLYAVSTEQNFHSQLLSPAQCHGEIAMSIQAEQIPSQLQHGPFTQSIIASQQEENPSVDTRSSQCGIQYIFQPGHSSNPEAISPMAENASRQAKCGPFNSPTAEHEPAGPARSTCTATSNLGTGSRSLRCRNRPTSLVLPSASERPETTPQLGCFFQDAFQSPSTSTSSNKPQSSHWFTVPALPQQNAHADDMQLSSKAPDSAASSGSWRQFLQDPTSNSDRSGDAGASDILDLAGNVEHGLEKQPTEASKSGPTTLSAADNRTCGSDLYMKLGDLRNFLQQPNIDINETLILSSNTKLDITEDLSERLRRYMLSMIPPCYFRKLEISCGAKSDRSTLRWGHKRRFVY